MTRLRDAYFVVDQERHCARKDFSLVRIDEPINPKDRLQFKTSRQAQYSLRLRNVLNRAVKNPKARGETNRLVNPVTSGQIKIARVRISLEIRRGLHHLYAHQALEVGEWLL